MNSRMLVAAYHIPFCLSLTVGVLALSGCPSSTQNSQGDAAATQALMQSCGTASTSAYNSQELITNLNDLLLIADRASRASTGRQRVGPCRLTAPANGQPAMCAQDEEDSTPDVETQTQPQTPGTEPTSHSDLDGGTGQHPDATVSNDAGVRQAPRPAFSGGEPTADDVITLVRLTTDWMCQASAPQLNTVFRYMSADYITHPEHRIHLDRLFRMMKVRLQARLETQERTRNPIVTSMDAVADVFMLAFVLDLQSGALRGTRSLLRWANDEVVLSARTHQALTRAERYGLVVDEMFRATRGRLSRRRLAGNMWVLGLSASLATASLMNTQSDYIDPQVVLDLARSQSMRLLGRRATELREQLDTLSTRNTLESRDQLARRVSENASELDTLLAQANELASLAPSLLPEQRIIANDIDLAFRALRRLRRELGDRRSQPTTPHTLP